MTTKTLETMNIEEKIDRLCENVETLKVDIATIKTQIITLPATLPCPYHTDRINKLETATEDLKKSRWIMIGIYTAITLIISVLSTPIGNIVFSKTNGQPSSADHQIVNHNNATNNTVIK